jgi:hypothetical protein
MNSYEVFRRLRCELEGVIKALASRHMPEAAPHIVHVAKALEELCKVDPYDPAVNYIGYAPYYLYELPRPADTSTSSVADAP